MLEKDFDKIQVKKKLRINLFVYEDGLVFPIYISDQTLETL